MAQPQPDNDTMAIYDQIQEKRHLILRLHKEFQEITSKQVQPAEAQKLREQVTNLQARMNKGIKELEDLQQQWDKLQQNKK